MLEHQNIEHAKARIRLDRAERALGNAEDMLGENCGAVVGTALCCTIRGARRRVKEAKTRLAKIDASRAN
ncbi:hypothetical protein AB6802_02035 [Mesorhizobium sp. RCC_202]|uniref:hypothetical protein n=1 Tax=Mesorhizobium sp. RCC_202 TaxID=3239222 RepID=UPI0035244E99